MEFPSTRSDAAHANHALLVIRVVGLLAFAFWVWRHMKSPDGLMHGSLLIFHEAGHFLFMPFGEFMMVLGGSLFQLMVPAFFVAYFARKRDWFATCFASLYLAASLVDVAVYIADARAGELPLITGDRSTHDWTFLLIELEMLDSDIAIGGFVKALGNTVFWLGLLAGLAFGIRGSQVDVRSNE